MLRLALLGTTSQAAAYNQRLPAGVTWTCFGGDAEFAQSEDGIHVRKTAELLAKADSFDAAVVHDPLDSLSELVFGLLAAGKHVCVDAQLLTSPLLATELCEAVAGHNEILSVAWPLRYGASQQAVRQASEAGKLGSAGLLRIHSWQPESKNENDLAARLTQLLDLAVWLVGERPSEIYSVGRFSSPADRTPTARAAYAQVHLGFPNKAMAIIDVAGTLPEGGDYFSLSMIGSDGAAYADDHHNQQLAFLGGPARSVRNEGSQPLPDQLRAFVEMIRGDLSPCPVLDAFAMLRMAEAALASMEARQVMKRQGSGKYELV